MRTVVVLGADTAVGRAIVEVLQERELEGLDVRAGALTERLGPGLDAIDEALLSAGDLFVLAFEGPMASGIATGLAKLGKPVLDLREGDVDDAPWIWPGLLPEAGAGLVGGARARLSVGLSSAILAVTQALAGLDPARVSVTTMESAAVFGQAGMDELSAQVRGVFTMQTPDPERLPASLAFDVIPSVLAAEDDPREADETLEETLGAGVLALGLPDVEVEVTRVLVPVFSAEAASMEIELAAGVEAEEIEARLRAGRTLRYLEGGLIPSLDAVGRDDALVGRLRVKGRRVRLWLAVDRLRRGSATLVALAVERWLEGASDTMSKPTTDA